MAVSGRTAVALAEAKARHDLTSGFIVGTLQAHALGIGFAAAETMVLRNGQRVLSWILCHGGIVEDVCELPWVGLGTEI